MTLSATLTITLTVPMSTNAEWVQNPIGVPRAPGCDPGYSWQKIGARYQCVTPQPSCAYGFESGPVWSGSSWAYTCNAPPPPPAPTCQYGYLSGPVWNGSVWIYQCNQPETPATPTRSIPELKAICTAYGQQQYGYPPRWADSLTYNNVAAGRTTFNTGDYLVDIIGDWQMVMCEVDNTTGQITDWEISGHGTDMGG
jgi:hypothetical protein